mmetsp:Transcript_1636/g.2239  ORF Transcript_1636/g.2239 Transcript_1636/m.2239 type:complete len:160 (+) Transcript_1636:91-570(+)
MYSSIAPLSTMALCFFRAQGFSFFCQSATMLSTRQSHHSLRIYHEQNCDLSRRTFGVAASILLGVSFPPLAASASGLIQFPLNRPVSNNCHFMRAGESLMEASNILTTNPLFVPNGEHALSPLGEQQVEEAIRLFESDNVMISRGILGPMAEMIGFSPW